MLTSPTILAAALDLDGTIIGPDEKISSAVHEAITRLSQHIPVFIATGREAADALHYARKLNLTTPQLCDGGANIIDPVRGISTWTEPLGRDSSKLVITKLKAIGVAFVATHANGTARNFDDVPNWDLIRVSALDMDEDKADTLANHFRRYDQMTVIKARLPYNGLWAIDFTLAGVNKATGVSQIGQILGIDPSNMVAIGDSYNDLPMLVSCGIGIAMGDAPEEIMTAADFVAPLVEDDGLAVAIDSYVMPRIRL